MPPKGRFAADAGAVTVVAAAVADFENRLPDDQVLRKSTENRMSNLLRLSNRILTAQQSMAIGAIGALAEKQKTPRSLMDERGISKSGSVLDDLIRHPVLRR
jgi:hypothetical protein